MTIKSVKQAMALPRNKAAIGKGDAIRTSRQSFGNSLAKLRLTISAPANIKTSQSNPPANSLVDSEAGSNAKLNSSSTTIENAIDAFSDSLVRHSERISLPATAMVSFRNRIKLHRHDHDRAPLDHPPLPACVVRNRQSVHDSAGPL